MTMSLSLREGSHLPITTTPYLEHRQLQVDLDLDCINCLASPLDCRVTAVL
jgi:hypothetical protein